MIILINTILSFAILLGFIQFIKNIEFFFKLLSFFYVTTNLTIVVLISVSDNINFIVDVVIILLLLQLLTVVTFLSNKIKSIYVDSIIIVYSWKRLDRISHEVYGSIDYGVLGEYVKELHVENQLPSSTNQIIYDFKNHSIVDNINLDK